MIISSVEEKKDIEESFINYLRNNELNMFTCEGLSVNFEVNLFERFEVDSNEFDEIKNSYNQDRGNFIRNLIDSIKQKNLYPEIHYDFVRKLLKNNNIIYNIIIHTNNCNNFLWIRLKFYKKQLIVIKFFNDCKEVSKKIYCITCKEEKKQFKEVQNLKCIDKCLREHNTPYPGNFDGLVFDNDLKPKFIIEYSKVDWVYKKELSKDINFHLNWYCRKDNGYPEDINRWKSLKDFGDYLQIPVYIIWWSTVEDEYAIGKLNNVTKDCHYTIEIIKRKITKDELFNYFDDLLGRL